MHLDLRHSCFRFATFALATLIGALSLPIVRAHAQDSDVAIRRACLQILVRGPRPLAEDRTARFEGKVAEPVARCRGGEKAVAARSGPWVDWSHYWATGNASSKSSKLDDPTLPIPPLLQHLINRNERGIDGALMDLEYQRMELIKFNLFDNATYQQYVTGRPDRRRDGRRPAPEGLAADAAAAGSSEFPRHASSSQRRPAVQRIAGALPHADRHLQRHPQSGDGIDRATVRPQRAVRSDLSRSRARSAGAQPARRPARSAQAGSAGDQPQAVHARPTRNAHLQQRPRHAGNRQRLRLQEGAVLQCACRLLDPVHDA